MITLKVNQRLHSWRGDFGQKALDTINLLVEENRAVLDTKELVAEQMATYLQKVPIQPGSNLYTYAYQWLEWDTEMDKWEVSLVMRMNSLHTYWLIRDSVSTRLSCERLLWRIWLYWMALMTFRRRSRLAHLSFQCRRCVTCLIGWFSLTMIGGPRYQALERGGKAKHEATCFLCRQLRW